MSKPQRKQLDPQEETINAPVGSPTSLTFSSVQGQVEGLFVGSEAPKYIIVRLPPDFDGNTLEEGQPLSIKYVSGGDIYRYNSSVLYFLKQFSLVFLSYPQSYDMQALRKEERINCRIPATANIDKKALKGLVTDISHHGCQFSVKIPATFKLHQVSVLTDIDLSLSLSGYTDANELTGKVRNTNIDEFKIVLGIEFDKLEEHLSQRLESYIENIVSIQ